VKRFAVRILHITESQMNIMNLFVFTES